MESRNTDFTQEAVERATKALTGILGGNVIIWNHLTHEPENPDEILIMDTNDIATARNVWRYNLAGWGHSTTGYQGPYTMAATMDSGIVADFITAGTLQAGMVRDKRNKNYWDLETGEFSLSADSRVGGSTVSQIANSAAASAVDGQTQQSVFNKLTNNGTSQGIYLQNGQLYINGQYIQADTIATNKLVDKTNNNISLVLSNKEVAGSRHALLAINQGEYNTANFNAPFEVFPGDPALTMSNYGMDFMYVTRTMLKHHGDSIRITPPSSNGDIYPLFELERIKVEGKWLYKGICILKPGYYASIDTENSKCEIRVGNTMASFHSGDTGWYFTQFT
jgi:hypothetical protein